MLKIKNKRNILALGKTDEIIGATLNEKQKLFCEYYAGSRETFGNATRSYILAYGMAWKGTKKEKLKVENVAAVNAHHLLRNPKLTQHINIIRQRFITDDMVDFEVAKVIMQDKELAPKVAGIKVYNDVRGRVVKKMNVDIRHLVLDLTKKAHEDANKPRSNLGA